MDNQSLLDSSKQSDNNLWQALGMTAGLMSVMFFVEPVTRAFEHIANKEIPNADIDITSSAILRRKGFLGAAEYYENALLQGYTKEKADAIFGQTTQFLNLSDLVDLKYRGLINETEYIERAAVVGFNKKDALNALDLNVKLLNSGDVITAFFRKVKGDTGSDELFKHLLKQGWSQDEIDTLIQISKNIPSMGDLYNIAAWGADDQHFVDQFKLDEGMPATFIDEAFKLGYDEQTARRMWRSHWQPPSLFILDRLFQTGAISETNLRQLLKSYQIPPFAIDELVKSFHKAPSDAQIIEMVQEKLITESQVVDYVKRNGYNETDAQNIAKLLIAKADAVKSADKAAKAAHAAAIRGLNVADIMSSYALGLITRDQAGQYLSLLEPDSQFIELQLTLEDSKIAKQVLSDQVSIIRDGLITGNLSVIDAQAALDQLNLTPEKKLHYLTLWQRQISKKDKRPDKSELSKFLVDGIIDEATFISELQLDGYSDKYIQWFLQEIIINASRPKAAGKGASPASGNSNPPGA